MSLHLPAPLKGHKTPYRDISLFPIRRIDYPYPSSSVFSAPFAKEVNKGKANGSNNGSGDSNSDLMHSGILGSLIVLDYRYARFALNPLTGLFQVVT
jgi:cation-transporting ATPase 13A2